MTHTSTRGMRILAWPLGIAGALASGLGAGVVVALGAPASFLLVYLVGILMGLLGGLVAYREPRNSIGWLMCATSWRRASSTCRPAMATSPW